MATEQERIAFCKAAAELGYKPSELVEAVKRAEMEKEANPLPWLTALIGGGLGKAIPAVAEFAVEAPFKALALASTAGALGGAGIAGAKNLVRNEYPHMFANEASPVSSELKEERLRQLIARYRNAIDKINKIESYEADVQNPAESPMMRYEFGGFGD
jgi:acetyl-CoA carboxylase carboxyltransferase component